MATQFDLVEPNVKEHLKRLVKTAGMPENSESLEQLATSWLEKQALFKAEITKNQMELVDSYAADEPKGALVMTYSGSLITIGPDSDELAKVSVPEVSPVIREEQEVSGVAVERRRSGAIVGRRLDRGRHPKLDVSALPVRGYQPIAALAILGSEVRRIQRGLVFSDLEPGGYWGACRP